MDRKSECSFCGKKNDGTTALIAGPAKHGNARICLECVDLCRESMDPERKRAQKEGMHSVYRVSQATDPKPTIRVRSADPDRGEACRSWRCLARPM